MAEFCHVGLVLPEALFCFFFRRVALRFGEVACAGGGAFPGGIFLLSAGRGRPFVLRDGGIGGASHRPPVVKTIQVFYS